MAIAQLLHAPVKDGIAVIDLTALRDERLIFFLISVRKISCNG